MTYVSGVRTVHHMSVRFEMRVDGALMARIDGARGKRSRARFFQDAADRALNAPAGLVELRLARQELLAVSAPRSLAIIEAALERSGGS